MGEEMKAIVVTSGSYSDAMQVKVFSSMEKFKEWAGEFENNYSTQEFEIDDMSNPNIVSCWYASINGLSGEIFDFEPMENTYLGHYGFYREGVDAFSVIVVQSIMIGRVATPLIKAVFPKETTKEQATKALADIRAQLFSNGMLGRPGFYNRTTLAPMEVK